MWQPPPVKECQFLFNPQDRCRGRGPQWLEEGLRLPVEGLIGQPQRSSSPIPFEPEPPRSVATYIPRYFPQAPRRRDGRQQRSRRPLGDDRDYIQYLLRKAYVSQDSELLGEREALQRLGVTLEIDN